MEPQKTRPAVPEQTARASASFRAARESPSLLELLYREVPVRINANLAGNPHRLERQLLGSELRMFYQCPGRRQGIRSTRPDRADPVVRFDHVAISRQHKRGLPVRYNQQRFEVPQR